MKIRSLFIYLNLTQYGIFNIKINNERQLIVHVKIHYNLQRTSFSERRGMGIQNTGETPVNPPMIIIIIRPRVNIVCPINVPRCFFYLRCLSIAVELRTLFSLQHLTYHLV